MTSSWNATSRNTRWLSPGTPRIHTKDAWKSKPFTISKCHGMIWHDSNSHQADKQIFGFLNNSACVWATVEIYCLRQVRHQVSESPIVLQAFLFLHIMTIIYLCLSIVLKRVHLDPHPWRSLLARVGAHLCFCPCLSGPPSRCLGSLFNQQVFWKENGSWHALATHSC